MKIKLLVLSLLLMPILAGTAWGDQIVLKNGQEYSGKFIRGDANVVEFRILGRVESFKITEVAQIVFKEPAIETAAATVGKTVPATTATVGKTPAAPPAAANVGVASPARPQVDRAATTQTTINPMSAQTDIPSTATFPEGSALTVRTTAAIDTDRNRAGDVFETTLDEPLILNDRVIVPTGTLVRGKIAIAKESGKISGQSELILELTEMVFQSKSYALTTSDYSEVGASRGKRTAATVGGTTALGAIIGAIAGGGKGAAIGAASGAAVGTGVQVMTKGQTLKIPAETILEFKLQSSLTVDVR